MKTITYKEVVAKQDSELHDGYVQMYVNGDNICSHCLVAAGAPLPMLGWTPGECDHGYEDGSFAPPDCTCDKHSGN